jgi:hypothetical protein
VVSRPRRRRFTREGLRQRREAADDVGDRTELTRGSLSRNAIDARFTPVCPTLFIPAEVGPFASSLYPFSAIHEESETRIKASKMTSTFPRGDEFTANRDPLLTTGAKTVDFHFGARGQDRPYLWGRRDRVDRPGTVRGCNDAVETTTQFVSRRPHTGRRVQASSGDQEEGKPRPTSSKRLLSLSAQARTTCAAPGASRHARQGECRANRASSPGSGPNLPALVGNPYEVPVVAVVSRHRMGTREPLDLWRHLSHRIHRLIASTYNTISPRPVPPSRSPSASATPSSG